MISQCINFRAEEQTFLKTPKYFFITNEKQAVLLITRIQPVFLCNVLKCPAVIISFALYKLFKIFHYNTIVLGKLSAKSGKLLFPIFHAHAEKSAFLFLFA